MHKSFLMNEARLLAFGLNAPNFRNVVQGRMNAMAMYPMYRQNLSHLQMRGNPRTMYPMAWSLMARHQNMINAYRMQRGYPMMHMPYGMQQYQHQNPYQTAHLNQRQYPHMQQGQQQNYQNQMPQQYGIQPQPYNQPQQPRPPDENEAAQKKLKTEQDRAEQEAKERTDKEEADKKELADKTKRDAEAKIKADRDAEQKQKDEAEKRNAETLREFWNRFDKFRANTAAARKTLADAQQPPSVSSNVVHFGIQGVIQALRADRNYLLSTREILTGNEAALKRVDVEIKSVEQELETEEKALQAVEKMIREETEKIVKEDTEKAFKETRGTIQERLEAHLYNASRMQKELDSISISGRVVDTLLRSNVREGIEKAMRVDEAAAERMRSLLVSLDAALLVPDMQERREAIQNIRSQINLARPNYRDSNALLARSQETLAKYDVMTRTPERAAFAIGEEVYARESEDVVDKGWTVESINGNQVTVTKNGQTLNVSTNYIWHIGEIEGGRAFNSNVPRHVQAELINRRLILLERYATLSVEEYHREFDGPLQQRGTGNCYMVAALNSLKNSPYAETVLRTSVRIEGNGYVVKIPLGDADGQPISITREEMNSTTTLPNGRVLTSLDGRPGWIAVEAGCIKAEYGRVNRAAAEGGLRFGFTRNDGVMARLFGNGVTESVIQSSNLRADLVSIGTSSFANYSAGRARAEAWLNGFSPRTQTATAGTTDGPGGDTSTFNVGSHTFFHNHAYSITNVNSQARQVVVVNPHNTEIEIRLTYEEFMQAFCQVQEARINFNNMFRI